MQRKASMDIFGAASLTLFMIILGFNQVAIKLGNDGFGPVFLAGLRSFGALLVLAIWMWARGVPMRVEQGTIGAGMVMGALFTMEFLFLFLALDLTTVGRTSVLFYSMPVWLTLAAHFLLPGEQLTRAKALGLALAMAGVAVAVFKRGDGQEASIWGDLFALGAAFCWGAISLAARLMPIKRASPEMQLFWQLALSAPVLVALAPFFGPLIREVEPLHWWLLGFQCVCVASLGFLFWFWLLTIYPAGEIASFGFLTPILGVLLGWLILDERMGGEIWLALALVSIGLILINRRARPVSDP